MSGPYDVAAADLAPYTCYPDLDGPERRLHQLAVVSNIATVVAPAVVLVLVTAWQPVLGVLLVLLLGSVIGWQLLQTFTAGRKVLRLIDAHPVDPRTQPALYRLAVDVADRMGMDLPPLYLVEDREPNAFATLASPSKPLVVLHTGLLAKLPPPAVKGVLAHEFAHIHNKDMLVRALIGALFRSAPRATSSRHQGLATDVAMMFVLAYKLLTALVFFAVTRSRERLADTTAAHAVGSSAMLDALRRIAELSDAGDRTSMFSTHPGLRSRIETLSDCCSRSARGIPTR